MADIEKLERDADYCVKQLGVRMFILLGVAGLAAVLVGDLGAVCVVGAVIVGVVCVFIRIDILSAKMTAMRIALTEEIRKSKE